MTHQRDPDTEITNPNLLVNTIAKENVTVYIRLIIAHPIVVTQTAPAVATAHTNHVRTHHPDPDIMK